MQTLASQHQTIVEMDSLAGVYRVTVFKQPRSKYLLARVVDDLFYYHKLTYKKIESQLDLLVKGQEVNQQEL